MLHIYHICHTYLISPILTGYPYSSLYLSIGVHVVPARRAARGPEPGLRQAVHRAAGQRR